MITLIEKDRTVQDSIKVQFEGEVEEVEREVKEFLSEHKRFEWWSKVPVKTA